MRMASEVVEKGIAEQVVLVPCGSHVFNKVMSETRHRVAMVKLVLDQLNEKAPDRYWLSTREVDHQGPSYAVETLAEIARLYPGEEVGWLMGSDQLAAFDRWHKYQEILARYKVYVYPRKGYEMDKLRQGMVALAEMPVVDIASTMVRETYQAGGDISEMVSNQVKDYIIQNELWKKQSK